MIGSESLREQLYAEIADGMLSHAYLIEGETGMGKHLLAMELCAAVDCAARGQGESLPCGHCTNCEKIFAGNSPDIRVIGKGTKSSIGVDDVRFLRSDVLIAPNDLAYKFYIIEDAQDLTVQAQNALLLTMEEPPPYVIFFLLCTNTANMLDTIRSRAPTLRLSPITAEEMGVYLTKTQRAFSQMEQSERAELICMARGSIGRALTLLDGRARKPLAERRRFVAETVDICLSRCDTFRRMECLRGFGMVRDEVLARLTLMTEALRDLLLLKKSDAVSLSFYADKAAASERSAQYSTAELMTVWTAVERARQRTLRNANIRLVLTALLLGEKEALNF